MLYTRFTSPKPLTAIHQVVANNLERMASLYTCYTDLYVNVVAYLKSTPQT